jgi:hypothetical protein
MSQGSKNKFTLDRFENDIAVLLDGAKLIEIPKKYLPSEAKEGDVLYMNFVTDEAETKKRSETAKELLNEILGSK